MSDVQGVIAELRGHPGDKQFRKASLPSVSQTTLTSNYSGKEKAGLQNLEKGAIHRQLPVKGTRREFFSFGIPEAPFEVAVDRQRAITSHGHAYLRHSWNRVDFVAISSFWIMFALSITGHESTPNAHIFIFRALSVLRLARLLAVTSGTTVSLAVQCSMRMSG